MSVLLTILKVLGITLLVILGLVLLVLGIVLLVPLRYRITGIKEEEGIKSLRGMARVSWLFSLLAFHVEGSAAGLQAELKIFGRKRKSFSYPKKKSESSGTSDASEKSTVTGEEDEHIKLNNSETTGEQEKPNISQSTSQLDQREDSPDTGAQDKQDIPLTASKQDKSETSGRSGEQSKPETPEASQTISEQEEAEASGDQDPHFLDRAVQKASYLLDRGMMFLFSLPEMSAEALLWLDDLYDRAQKLLDGVSEKVRKIEKKIGPFTTAGAMGLWRRVFRSLMKVLRHYRLRRAQGYIRFGTGMPDVTGVLTGVLYQVLPAGCDHYDVLPEFTERCLMMDTTLSGHIRLIHLAAAVVRLAVDREVWQLIRRLRHKKSRGE